MARINLLPWRAERRKQRQKEFGVMLGVTAVGALVLAMGINMYFSNQIDGQNARNAYVQQQIDDVDKQITEIAELNKTKARLLARKEVIEKLQASRSQMVHLFDSLVRTIPDGVVLTSIKQDDQSLTLEGRSQSNARVSTYMRNLEGSGWMTDPQLSVIEAKGEDKGLPYQFSLSVKLADPNAPRDTDGDGVPDAEPAAAPAANAPATGPAPAAAPATPAPAPAAASTTPGGKS
ncbi:fimbrial protein [Lysobacter sp. TY2-98]|uniref:PilN domain-containing protein n=1 Tax=Lysobacter sp. TY2-98 TaxID=2290922 RepID=UPI000E206B42|nr:PilN domain-containing protein [Lysobacter sp. TY2-98]AXK71136.1 fimbrial protein [Lysobacter sp. TY2-98]